MGFLDDLFDFDRKKHHKQDRYYRDDHHDQRHDHDEHGRYEQSYQDRPGASCPKCSGPTLPSAKFCQSCGVPLNVALNCSKCGNKITGDASFCPGCGNKVK